LLVNRFSDQSQRLVRALQHANKRAWDALEISLAGESFWRRFDAAEDKAFRQQVRAFLDAMPLPELTGKDQHRRQCLRDLQAAKRKGLIFGHVVPEDLAQRAGAFARHTDPQALLEAEKKALRELAVELHSAGFKALGWLLSQPAHPGQSVIVVAVRYFFRREVEGDEVRLVRDLLSRYRALPEQERRGAPALLNDMGKLQVAVGDFDAAETSFTQAATLTTDTRARAEAYYNASRAALERGDFTGSLADLKRALALDPARFAPFPLADYEPERIL